MARIEQVWWQPFRIPFRQPFLAAHGSVHTRDGLLIGVETDAGLSVGEVSPLPSFGGGDLEECTVELRRLGPLLIGRDVAACWATPLPLAGGLSEGSRGALACGLETALADRLAHEAGLSLWQWLAVDAGLEAGRQAPIPVNALIDSTSVEQAVRGALAAAGAGYATLKLKVGLDAQADEARIAAVHRACGPAIALRVDANAAWSVEEAITRLKRYETLGVVLAEQPVPALAPGAVPDLAAVRSNTRIAIAADEACRDARDAERLIAAGAVDALVVKPMIIGLRAAVQVIATGAQDRIPSIVTTSFDTGLGTMVAIHLAALVPEPRLACGLSTLSFLEFDIARGTPTIASGTILPPTRPGLGVTIDDDPFTRAASGPREMAQAR